MTELRERPPAQVRFARHSGGDYMAALRASRYCSPAAASSRGGCRNSSLQFVRRAGLRSTLTPLDAANFLPLRIARVYLLKSSMNVPNETLSSQLICVMLRFNGRVA
jgi:hypothetical protein